MHFTNSTFFYVFCFFQVDSFPLDQQSIEIPETECSDSCENDVDMDESDSCDNDADDNEDSEGEPKFSPAFNSKVSNQPRILLSLLPATQTTRRTTTTSTAARSSRASSCWTTTRSWSTKVGAAEVAVVVEAAGPVPTTKRPASKPCWKRQVRSLNRLQHSVEDAGCREA